LVNSKDHSFLQVESLASNPRLLGYINWQLSGATHPPWHIHLLWADLIGDSIIKEFQKCATCLKNNNCQVRSTHQNSKGISVPKLPLIRSGTSMKSCSQKYPYYPLKLDAETWMVKNITHTTYNNIDQDSNNIEHKTNEAFKQIGTFSSSYWKLTEDRKGKFGWISRVSYYKSSPKAILSTDRETIDSSIYFYPNFKNFNKKLKSYHHNHHHNNQAKISHQNSTDIHFTLLITIQYLKSYENAGVFDIYVCDEFKVSINTIWELKYSLAESTTIELPINITNVNTVCSHPSQSFLKLKHNLTKIRDDDRGDHKIRLISVTSCISGHK
jgi:hypothetical protein